MIGPLPPHPNPLPTGRGGKQNGSVHSPRRREGQGEGMSGKEAQIAALTAEAHHWAARRSADPYDRGARENLARVLFAMQRDRFPLGTVERSQHLLSIIGDAFPIAPVRSAYFENLERLLAQKPRRAAPGMLVLGLGSGRCGSTSLTALIASVADSVSTHENPPVVYWDPL